MFPEKKINQLCKSVGKFPSLHTPSLPILYRRNKKGATASCLRHLCFFDEKKIMFSRGKVVLYRMKIRSETTNITEVNITKVKCRGAETFLFDI